MNRIDPSMFNAAEEQRRQPIQDLVSRLTVEPVSVVDFGCRTGLSSGLVVERFTQTRLVGVDTSIYRIAAARAQYPNIEFRAMDLSGPLHTLGMLDMIMACDTQQWTPDHPRQIMKLFDRLHSGGVLAALIDADAEAPYYHALAECIQDDAQAQTLRSVLPQDAGRPLTFYYELLRHLSSSIEIWETTYCQIMPDHRSILQWLRAGALWPVLSALTEDEDRKSFEERYLQQLVKAYPMQTDGKILLRTKNLFFVAVKRGNMVMTNR